MSFLSKEHGITVLALCAIYEAVVRCQLHPIRSLLLLFGLASPRPSETSWIGGFRTRVLALISLGVGLLFGRIYIMHGQRPIFNHSELPGSFAPELLTRVLTLNYLVAFNAYLMIFPVYLCSDWAFGSIALVDTLVDPRVLATLAFYTLVTWQTLKYFGHLAVGETARRNAAASRSKAEVEAEKKKTNAGSVIVAIAFTVVPFLPSSNLFFTVGFVVAERVLYIPRYWTIATCTFAHMG